MIMISMKIYDLMTIGQMKDLYLLGPVNSLLCDTEEEILWIHVLVDHVQPAFLMSETLALTSLNKARKL